MRIRLRIFLGYFIIVTFSLCLLAKWTADDIRRYYLESLEENLVDTSHVLSAILSESSNDSELDIEALKSAFKCVKRRKIEAKIYDLTKSYIDLEIYVTDVDGTVLFDSETPSNKGQDFSNWRDVDRTLKGQYGARATRLDKNNPASLIMHVASPVIVNKKLAGVLTVRKPVGHIMLFVYRTKDEIFVNAIIIGLLVSGIGLVIAGRISRPVRKLTDYARLITSGRRSTLPETGDLKETKDLATAFEHMRKTLEGKEYIEEYVQSLAHGLKSPLSAVKGATELLLEANIDTTVADRLLGNISIETERMQQLVERMLKLSALENQQKPHKPSQIDIAKLLQKLANSRGDATRAIEVKLELASSETPYITGEECLIYEAIDNLLANAVEFSYDNSEVIIKTHIEKDLLGITVIDSGQGIPDYATERVFERFYSLPRTSSGIKSSGLGLSIAKEIVELHAGSISITRRDNGGTSATILLPLSC